MRARLIIDSSGPNPDFAPPDPKREPIAFQLYCAEVSPTRSVPAGTELEEHEMAWIHCVPDAFGVIRAEPADDECRRMVEAHLEGQAKAKRKPLAQVRREHDRAVTTAKQKQAAAPKAGAASAAPVPAPQETPHAAPQ